MTTNFLRRPEARTGVRRRSLSPRIEGLERRELLYATLGGSFVYGSRITYSFVPDGTNIGGVSSNLYAKLNSVTSTDTWQTAFNRAAAIWSSYANINMVEVPDDGSPLSVSGNQQGDPRFGDIRISMIPQAAGVLGTALKPPPFNGGTAAGDIILNSNVMWAVNGNYDIQTVAMHEIGHSLGLDHTTITNAVMYGFYNNVKQSLTSDDIAGIQAVYGAYPADAYNDGSFATATNLTPLIDSNGQVALGGQSLAGGGDLDFFVVTVPANTNGTMTVSMQSTNLSSVSPRLAVFRSNFSGIGMTALPNSFGATATYTVTGVSPGQTYYFRASAASGFGSYGAYGMLVNFGSGQQAPIPPPNTVVASQPSQGGGSLGYSSEVVQIGDTRFFGEQLKASAKGPDSKQDRYDPAGWSVFLAGMGFLDDKTFDKATKMLAGFQPRSWDVVFDRVLATWGDSDATYDVLKELQKDDKRKR